MQRDRSQAKLKYTLYVGPYGDFQDLKSAIDWCNDYADEDIAIQIDSGHYLIDDTITIDCPYIIQIMGKDTTFLDAATGLTGKPMFIVSSDCDFRYLTMDGSTLTDYGTVTGENGIQYGTAGVYSEMVDAEMYNFKIGHYDPVGVDNFLFNFVIADCECAFESDYSSDPGALTFKDIEVGNIEGCTTGIHFKQAYLENFMVAHVIFIQNASPAATAVLYDGTNYHVDGICNLFNLTYNNVGTFMSGFDFSRADGRDANIEVIANIGTEDKLPHAKINIIDSTVTTPITVGGTFYKANINSKKTIDFNVAATSGNFTITIGDQTTDSIAWNASAATIQTAINNLSNVTSVTVVQVTAAKKWTVEFLTTGEGWLGMQPVVNIGTLSPTTSADVTPDTYSCKFGITNNKMTYLTNRERDVVLWVAGSLTLDANRNVEVGVRKNGIGVPLGPVTIRVTGSGVVTPFSTIVYVEEMALNDYVELWVTAPNSGDIVTVLDVSWFIKAI